MKMGEGWGAYNCWLGAQQGRTEAWHVTLGRKGPESTVTWAPGVDARGSPLHDQAPSPGIRPHPWRLLEKTSFCISHQNSLSPQRFSSHLTTSSRKLSLAMPTCISPVSLPEHDLSPGQLAATSSPAFCSHSCPLVVWLPPNPNTLSNAPPLHSTGLPITFRQRSLPRPQGPQDESPLHPFTTLSPPLVPAALLCH